MTLNWNFSTLNWTFLALTWNFSVLGWAFLVLNLIFSAAHMSHRINDTYKTVSRAEKFLGLYSRVIVYCNTIFLVGDTFLGIRVSLREIYIKININIRFYSPLQFSLDEQESIWKRDKSFYWMNKNRYERDKSFCWEFSIFVTHKYHDIYSVSHFMNHIFWIGYKKLLNLDVISE